VNPIIRESVRKDLSREKAKRKDLGRRLIRMTASLNRLIEEAEFKIKLLEDALENDLKGGEQIVREPEGED